MSDLERKLYVGCLPLDIKEDELRETFGVYGAVEDIVVLTSKEQQRPDRSGFVKFYEKEDAAAAKAVLADFYKFRSDQPEPIRVSFAKAGKSVPTPAPAGGAAPPAPAGLPPPPAPPGMSPPAAPAPTAGTSGGAKVWVGNLPADTQRPEVENIFGAFGRILDVNILPPKSKSGMLCGFVHFENGGSADACLIGLGENYQMRPGAEPIKVERATGGRKGGGKGDKGGWGPMHGGKGGCKGGPY
eukprot:TRINITY_DN8127_c1_g1_i1.p1 TRINITY_DN8127_c1_g1~~TRINITY_DN8127_c1_g1_i1.p1  ORF type:complete len:243 (-),score=82.27 TRINITY_DN8127_c1_g1_i1:230-958(-)